MYRNSTHIHILYDLRYWKVILGPVKPRVVSKRTYQSYQSLKIRYMRVWIKIQAH